MANLDTVIATSNPQTNINQIQNANGLSNTASQSNQANTINPITIPIQIQPQIANNQPTTNVQPNTNLQTNVVSSAPTPQTYQGNNNTNTIDFNQIYQTYQNQYGNTYNQNTNNSSGIKKTSIGTTIVTPTTTNLNSVEGQYQSAYADTVNSVISTLLSQTENLRNGNFGYDPTQDNALRMASEYAANSTLQSLAGSGVLNSSATSERVARIVSELIPQYEQLAYERQLQYLSQLSDTAQLVMNFDSQQFQYWKDAKDREFQQEQFDYQKAQDNLENAWKRVDELGFVDNEASTILGVRVGTLSKDAREAKEQREYELNKMREQLLIEYNNNVALAKIRTELETQQSKELADYNANIERNLYSYKSNIDTARSKELADYEASIEKNLYNYKSNIDTAKSKELADYNTNLEKNLYNYKSSIDTENSKSLADYNANIDKNLYSYKSSVDTAKSKELSDYETNNSIKYYNSTKGTSSKDNTEKTSLNTYKDTINNRWGFENIVTGQISLTDSETGKSNNDAVYNYLWTEYNAGRLSQADLATLVAMYGITQPTVQVGVKNNTITAIKNGKTYSLSLKSNPTNKQINDYFKNVAGIDNVLNYL